MNKELTEILGLLALTIPNNPKRSSSCLATMWGKDALKCNEVWCHCCPLRYKNNEHDYKNLIIYVSELL